MLSAGHYYKLRVNRISDFGLYLSDDEENEVLLPNRYVSLENKVGDELDVFVYCDSEDRLVATTDRRWQPSVKRPASRWWTKRSTALSSTGA